MPDQLPEGPAVIEHSTLKPAEFDRVRKLAYDHFGLDLKEGKQMLVATRLGKLMRRKGIPSYRKYLDHVAEDRSGEEMVEMIDALTTNYTSFMRESSHFDLLRDRIVPALRDRSVIEIWSAACSTGEEPYSILFTLIEALGRNFGVRVLASDISTRALAVVKSGLYEAKKIEPLPLAWQRTYFLKGTGEWLGWYRVKPEYRQMVECARINLTAGELPARQFPVIFCRNVMIYFDKPTQSAVVRRLSNLLEPGGHLLVGHSESLTGGGHGLEYVMPAVYRTPQKGATWRKRG